MKNFFLLACLGYTAVSIFLKVTHPGYTLSEFERLKKENQQLHQMVNLLIEDKVTIRE